MPFSDNFAVDDIGNYTQDQGAFTITGGTLQSTSVGTRALRYSVYSTKGMTVTADIQSASN
jgi:hypothetical protein